jgi:hypothetical protein
LQQLDDLQIPDELPENPDKLKGILKGLWQIVRGTPEDINSEGITRVHSIILSTLLANTGIIVTRKLMNHAFPFWDGKKINDMTTDAHVSRLDRYLTGKIEKVSTKKTSQKNMGITIKLPSLETAIDRHHGLGWSMPVSRGIDILRQLGLPVPT